MILFPSTVFSCPTSPQELYIKNEYYNFIDPNMVNISRQNPLYKLSNSKMVHTVRSEFFKQRKKDANIQAWMHYFKGELSKVEIEAIFYEENSIAKSAEYYQNSSKYPNFSKYLDFLNLQNSIAQNKSRKRQAYILKTGLQRFEDEEEPFLKERYLYLLMRLYHHTGQYEKV